VFQTRRRAVLVRLPAVFWAALVLLLLTMPGSSVPNVYFWTFGIDFDKFAHGVLFFVQAILLYPALRNNSRRPIIFSVLLATVYGGLLECVQAVLPDRSASIMDFVADGAGALIFAIAWAAGVKKIVRFIDLQRDQSASKRLRQNTPHS
jgi:VanZ family protein